MFSFLNLSGIWSFISPIIADLLKEGGKKFLERVKNPSNREKFISLYTALGDFEEKLKNFVDIFEKYITYSEMEKHSQELPSNLRVFPQDIVISGNLLSNTLETLEKAFQKVFPEYEIYAQKSFCLLSFVIRDEDITVRNIISELQFTKESENQFSNLLKDNMDDSLQSYDEFEFLDPLYSKNQTGWINVDNSTALENLRDLLDEAKNNYTRTTVAIEELRQFIRMNIPMKVD